MGMIEAMARAILPGIDEAADFVKECAFITAQAAARAAEPFIQARIDEAVKAMQEAAARVASEAHLIQPDGRSSSEDECEVARNAAACIRAINYLRDNIDKLEAMETRDAE